MTKSVTMKGQCLCGSVQITLPDTNAKIGACHCRMCQQWSGGPGMAIHVEGEVEVEGQEHIKAYQSSDWAERVFCENCGSNLYYRLTQADKYFVWAGLFYGDENLALDHQVFIDEKPTYYSFAEKTPELTGAELMAMFSES